MRDQRVDPLGCNGRMCGKHKRLLAQFHLIQTLGIDLGARHNSRVQGSIPYLCCSVSDRPVSNTNWAPSCPAMYFQEPGNSRAAALVTNPMLNWPTSRSSGAHSASRASSRSRTAVAWLQSRAPSASDAGAHGSIEQGYTQFSFQRLHLHRKGGQSHVQLFRRLQERPDLRDF